MNFFSHAIVCVSAAWLPLVSQAQTAPEHAVEFVGPFPVDQAAQGALVSDMQARSRDTCAVSILLRLSPSDFPTERHASPEDFANQFGAYLGNRASLGARVYLVTQDGRGGSALVFVDGNLLGKARGGQNISVNDFLEWAPRISVAHHSLKRMRKEGLVALQAQNEKLAVLLREAIQSQTNIRDLAEMQLILLGGDPADAFRLSQARRAAPATDVERQMVAFLDATEVLSKRQADLDPVEADLRATANRIRQTDCAFPATDKLYGEADIETLRPRVSRDLGLASEELTIGQIKAWIVETGFGVLD